MPDIYRHIVDLRASGRSAVLVTVVAKSGHIPLPPPGKILVDAGGPVAGTVGGGALEALAIEEAKRFLATGTSAENGSRLKEYLLDEERPGGTAEAAGMLCGGKATLFFEILGSPPRAYLFGAGHVGQAVAGMLRQVDYAPVLVDCRPDQSPDLLAGPDYTTLPELPGLAEASVVIATHAHKGDQRVLEHLLDLGVRPPYVGMVASTRKWRAIAENLAASRNDATDLSWVNAPAGLRLGGRTPAEIALAITAEIQATRTGAGDHDHMANGAPFMIEVRFVLNDRPAAIRRPGGLSTLNWLREDHVLTGTKEGCAEGECGACAVLLGDPTAKGLVYRAVPACLLPVGELGGRHLVTIEGLDQPGGLNLIQQALVDEGAPQCGFCFPGIVIALTGYFLTCSIPDPDAAVAALDGNICRCTGYASTVRALTRVCAQVAPLLAGTPDRVAALVEARILPPQFPRAADALAGLGAVPKDAPEATLVGGGTDLLVQRGDDLAGAPVALISRRPELGRITRETDGLIIGGGVTIEDLARHADAPTFLPDMNEVAARFGSILVRNRATVAGNLVNASPIGDMSVLLLAHGAELVLRRGERERRLPLASFFRGYKDLDLKDSEVVAAVRVPRLDPGAVTSYEKVSKRRNLDIASVNSAAVVRVADGKFAAAVLAVGGVAPVPLLLTRTPAALIGQPATAATALAAARVLDDEIAPIDDVRGSARYKALLARRLLFAHLLKAAPDLLRLEELV